MIGILIQAKLEIGTLIIEEITEIEMKEALEAIEIMAVEEEILEVEEMAREEAAEVGEDAVEVVEEAVVEISIVKIAAKQADIGGILIVAIKNGHQIIDRVKMVHQAVGVHHQTKKAAITKIIVMINQETTGALLARKLGALLARQLGETIMMPNLLGAQLIKFHPHFNIRLTKSLKTKILPLVDGGFLRIKIREVIGEVINHQI